MKWIISSPISRSLLLLLSLFLCLSLCLTLRSSFELLISTSNISPSLSCHSFTQILFLNFNFLMILVLCGKQAPIIENTVLDINSLLYQLENSNALLREKRVEKQMMFFTLLLFVLGTIFTKGFQRHIVFMLACLIEYRILLLSLFFFYFVSSTLSFAVNIVKTSRVLYVCLPSKFTSTVVLWV